MLRGSLAATAAPPRAGVLRRRLLRGVPRRRAQSSRRAARAALPPPPPPVAPPAPAFAVPSPHGADVLSVAVPAPAPAQLPALSTVPAALMMLAGALAIGQLWATWRTGWSARRSSDDGLSAVERHRRAADARAPIAIFHDLENCSIPAAVEAWSVAGAVLAALRASGYGGQLRGYTAFGDMALLRPAVRRQLSSTGVRLSDVPSGRKDAADRALLLDMLLFARDTPPPAVVLLITGDRDFAPTAHRLTQLGYTVLLSAPIATAQVAPELLSAAYRRFDWASMACGLVPFEERERERAGASRDDDETEPSVMRLPSGGASSASSAASSTETEGGGGYTTGGSFRSGRGKSARIGAFVSAAAAAIEREDVDELARVVASAQLSGLKASREAALLEDMRRRLKRREAAAEDVSAALERAIAAADPQLAASALLAARRRGVSRVLAPQVAAAERIVRANRVARRGSRRIAGTADVDDEDEDEDDEDEDDDDDSPVVPVVEMPEQPEAQTSQRRASAALKEHRLSSRRRIAFNEVEASDSWAGQPWVSTDATVIEAADAVSLPPAADDPWAMIAAYESNPSVPRWFTTALRVGLEGHDFAILSSAIARGTAAKLDTAGASTVLAFVTRARSVAGSLVRLSLTRKGSPLASLMDSLAGNPVEALLTKELAEARDALKRILAVPVARVTDDAEGAQFKERVLVALAEEDPVALRAALLDAVINTNVVHEFALRRLKVLMVAHESIPELQRACAAGDRAVLKARVLRVRRDFIVREPHRSFPATDGKLLAALTAAVEEAEAVLGGPMPTDDPAPAPADGAAASDDPPAAAVAAGPGDDDGSTSAVPVSATVAV